MDPNQPAPGTTASVAVTYEAFGGARNPELRGKGILTVSGGKYPLFRPEARASD